MGTIILLLIVFFVVIPLFKAAMAVYRARKQYRDMFDMFTGARQAKAEPRQERRRGGWTSPAKSRKKIDPAVGEYVEFEEIACNTTTRTEADGSRSTETEQQIVDAEWEDIK